MLLLLPLLSAVALGGELLVEASVPTEVHVNGQPVAQVFYPSEVKVQLQPGEVELTVFVDGHPSRYRVEIPDTGQAVVVVGRTGITTSRRAAPRERADILALPVEVRSAARSRIMVVFDQQRHWVDPGQVLHLELDPGRHGMSVRSGGGTEVWARGVLDLRAEEGTVLIQVAEGMLPEVATGPAVFSPGEAL